MKLQAVKQPCCLHPGRWDERFGQGSRSWGRRRCWRWRRCWRRGRRGRRTLFRRGGDRSWASGGKQGERGIRQDSNPRARVDSHEHRYFENQAIAVNTIQIPLRTIMGIAGIGFFLAAYERAKWTSNRTETSNPKTNPGTPGDNKPATIRSTPL